MLSVRRSFFRSQFSARNVIISKRENNTKFIHWHNFDGSFTWFTILHSTLWKIRMFDAKTHSTSISMLRAFETSKNQIYLEIEYVKVLQNRTRIRQLTHKIGETGNIFIFSIGNKLNRMWFAGKCAYKFYCCRSTLA